MRIPLPCIMEALEDLLQRNNMELPSAPLTVAYRAECQGIAYYSRQYARVKKRNSYTVMYWDSGVKHFGLIEYFAFVQQRLIAILKPLIPVQTSCKQHFHLSTDVLDTLSFLMPVARMDSIKCCFVEDFSAKCLSVNFGTEYYVLKFPSSVMFF